MREPELITIIEGPTPSFQPVPFLWAQSVYEGTEGAEINLCELRTNTGEDIVARCKDAWREGRPVQLDFPDEMRLRQQLDVVAMRLKEIEEGMVLMLWVRQPIDEAAIQALQNDFGDDFNDDFDDDDDLLV